MIQLELRHLTNGLIDTAFVPQECNKYAIFEAWRKRYGKNYEGCYLVSFDLDPVVGSVFRVMHKLSGVIFNNAKDAADTFKVEVQTIQRHCRNEDSFIKNSFKYA